jgi:hypothetical protein
MGRSGGGREGGPGTAENGSGCRHQPPAGRHGRRRCRAIVAGGGTRAAWTRVADSGTGRPRGRVGSNGVRGERYSMMRR